MDGLKGLFIKDVRTQGGRGGNRFADKGGGGVIDLRTRGVSGMRTSIFQLFPRRKIADCFIPFSVFRASVNHA